MGTAGERSQIVLVLCCGVCFHYTRLAQVERIGRCITELFQKLAPFIPCFLLPLPFSSTSLSSRSLRVFLWRRLCAQQRPTETTWCWLEEDKSGMTSESSSTSSACWTLRTL